jgi:hypothetical protein
MALLRKFWGWWKAFGHVLGQIQTTIILSIIYHIAIGPISLVGRALRRPFLELHSRDGGSFADRLAPITTTLDRAHKQY